MVSRRHLTGSTIIMIFSLCMLFANLAFRSATAQKPQLVYSRPVVIDGLNFGDIQIFEGQEPADAAYSFINQHKLGNNVKTAILQDACTKLRCTRESAVLYRKPVADQNNNLLGTIEIYEGQEPVDVVYKFCQQHNLGIEYRNAIMDDCCQSLECSRTDAIIYRNTIRGDGKVFGLLEVFESQEPADAVHEFATQRGMDRELRDVLIRNVCGALPYKCSRLVPVVYKKPVSSEEGKVVGTLSILEGDEPVDVAHRFVMHHGLPVSYRHAILNSVCASGVVPCTRTEPLLYSKPVAREDGVRVGTVSIYEGQEPADVIYQFVAKHGLDWAYKNAILRDACHHVKCQRAEARIYKKEIVLEERGLNKEIIGGVLEIYEGQEPADVVYHFCQERGVSREQFHRALESVCAEIPCSRTSPIVFTLPISSPESERIGVLTILQDEEPVDAILKFFLNHGLVKKGWDRTPIMNHVCRYLPCMRGRGLAVNSSLVLEDGRKLPPLLVWEDEEPADVIYRFAQDLNLTLDMRKNILVNVCRKQLGLCNRPDPIVYSFEVSKEHPYTCSTNKAGWRFLSPSSRWFTNWPGYEKYIAPQLNNDTSTHPYTHSPYFEGAVWLGLALHLIPFLLFMAYALHRFYGVRDRALQREKYYGHTIPSFILELSDKLEEEQAASSGLGPNEDGNSMPHSSLAVADTPEENNKRSEAPLFNDMARELEPGEHFLSKPPSESESMPAGEKVEQDDGPTSKSKARRKKKRRSTAAKKAAVMQSGLAEEGTQEPVNGFAVQSNQNTLKEELQGTSSASETMEDMAMNDYHEAFEPKALPVLSILCKSYFTAFLGSFLILWVLLGLEGWITPDAAIDAALWKTKLVADLQVLEGEEPVDAVYDFAQKHYLKEIMHSPLHKELIAHVCNESLVLNCTRLRSRELLAKGSLTQNGITFEIKYQRPEGDDYCRPLEEGIGTNCTLEGAKKICSRLMPPPDDCVPMMLDFIDKELANHERKRWKGKTDHYRALGILKDSSDAEAEIAYRKLAPQYGGIVFPYAPPANRTEPHYWEEDAKKLWKVKEAYKTLCTPKEREFYDKPCEPVFGGAMCARRTADGGLQILVEQGEE